MFKDGYGNIIFCDKCCQIATMSIITERTGKKTKQMDLCDNCYEEYKKMIDRSTKKWLKEK